MSAAILALALLSGFATWYDDPRKDGMYAAAGPALREGDWRGRVVQVCTTRCLRVTLSDACQCYVGTARERIIDLSPAAFARLGNLSAGLLAVTVDDGWAFAGRAAQLPS